MQRAPTIQGLPEPNQPRAACLSGIEQFITQAMRYPRRRVNMVRFYCTAFSLVWSGIHMSNNKKQSTVLIVLDGWGYREEIQDNAIANAATTVWDRLWREATHTLISASG
jgi:hypothetical protein